MSSRLTEMARNLRKKATEAEHLLWRRLRGRQLDGFKFRRQQPIGRYIVDLVCFEERLVVEVDGAQHMNMKDKERDDERDRCLKEQGFRVLRFWDNEVLTNINGVLETIRQTCLVHPPLAPPIEGGELKGRALVSGITRQGADDQIRGGSSD